MLSRPNRLTKRGSFSFVYSKGERYHLGPLSLCFVRGKNLKVGFSVPNKVGNAVIRNKVKRQMRAIVRSTQEKLQAGQLVFSARAEVAALTFLELKEKMLKLISRIKK